MSESKTPRTDAEQKWLFSIDGQMQTICVHVEFAKALERSLNEAKSEVDSLKTQLGSAYKGEWQEDYGLKLRTRKGA